MNGQGDFAGVTTGYEMGFRKTLPPMKGLIVLECVVRRRSVSEAADELCVTHSAVSKQLSILSDWFGKPLFTDNRRRMVPTPGAIRLASGIGAGMRTIREAVDGLSEAEENTPTLHVIAPATLAINWLIPHLPALSLSGPSLKAEVRNTHTEDNWLDLRFDIAIRSDEDVPAGYESLPIFQDTLGLVAAPEVAHKVNDQGALRDVPLLESETRPGELDGWLNKFGVERDIAPRIETFNHNYIAIEGAVNGLGAVVAPLTVVSQHLKRGSLMRIMPDIRLPGPNFCAVYKSRIKTARQSRLFTQWLQHLNLQDDYRQIADGCPMMAS